MNTELRYEKRNSKIMQPNKLWLVNVNCDNKVFYGVLNGKSIQFRLSRSIMDKYYTWQVTYYVILFLLNI